MKKVYILYTLSEDGRPNTIGVFETFKSLSNGVDGAIKRFNDKVLVYESYFVDMLEAGVNWDFAYIPENYDNLELLKSGGGIIPKFRGINLPINLDLL